MKAFFEKYGIWIAIGFIILWLVKIQRTMSLQNVLIVSLAKKAGLELTGGKNKKEQDDDEFTEHEDVTDQEEEQEEEEKKELNEDEINQLVEDMQRISEQIKNNEAISKENEEYYRLFFNDMHPDLNLEPLPQPVGATIVPLHQNQPSQKVELKQETTKANQNNQSKEKTTFEANGQTPSNKENKQGKSNEPVKKYTAQEKKDMIIEFFNEGKPLYQKEIAEKLATATNTKVNPGNTNGLVAELVAEKRLSDHSLKIDGKTYYGLLTWFDKKKLTKEYLIKLKNKI